MLRASWPLALSCSPFFPYAALLQARRTRRHRVGKERKEGSEAVLLRGPPSAHLSFVASHITQSSRHPLLFLRFIGPMPSAAVKREFFSPSPPPAAYAKRTYRMDDEEDEIDELAPNAPYGYGDEDNDGLNAPEAEVDAEGDTFYRVRFP